MIRAIDNKPLDLTDKEFEYYLQITKAFGDKVFQDTFEVDEHNGFIIMVKPPMTKTLPLGAVYFLLNIQLNQRIREFENIMEEFKTNKKDLTRNVAE